MVLHFVWDSISMQSASVTSNLVPELERFNANQHVTDYFNWSFGLILPWVQGSQFVGLNAFNIPKEVPGIIYLEDLQLAIRKNYLSFGMEPQFLFGGLKPKLPEVNEEQIERDEDEIDLDDEFLQ